MGGEHAGRRLSVDLAELAPRYDVVVVGSGYGGAIMASRLARAGRSVAVLERGREQRPGDHPTAITDAPGHLQVQTRWRRFGSPTALFDVRLFRGQSVLVGCGLGGTSLINGNVALRASADVFDDAWPTALRAPGHVALDPYYERAERWLGASPYPGTAPGLPKQAALRAGAAELGGTFSVPPITVTTTRATNPAGVEQPACTLCGDCCSGCNVGAKNTVLQNYLPDAHRHGATIVTEVSVRAVRRGRTAGWLVDVVPLTTGRRHFGAPPLVVGADVVVLAAGTLGTSEILLHSKAAGLPLSDRLGHRFNGNGDVLGFAYDTATDVDAVGWGARTGLPVVGPTITGRISVHDPTTDDEITIEEGAIPGPLAPLVPLAVTGASLLRRDVGVVDRLGRAMRSWRRAARRTLTYLVMSTDDGDGRLHLDDEGDALVVDWEDVGSQPIFRVDDALLRSAAGAIGGTYLPQPAWRAETSYSLITVHPLGGCVMADRAEAGVVDDRGRVFAGTHGTEVHEGLVVADGSVVPRPRDVNPLLTISALAERSADLLASERGWTIDRSEPPVGAPPSQTVPPSSESSSGPPATPPRPPEPDPARAARAARVGLRMTERMAGWITPGAELTLAPGWSGRPERSARIELVVTIEVDDLDALLLDASLEQRLVGTVEAPSLSPEPLLVQDGRFRLLEPVPEQVETCHMHYAMDLVATDGRRFHLEGVKVVRNGPLTRLWPDTTTLYVTLHDAAGADAGRGVMRITAEDVVRMLRTLRIQGPRRRVDRARYALAFQRMFLTRMFHLFGGVAAELDRLVPVDARPKPDRPLHLPPPEVRWCGELDRWHDGDASGETIGDDAWLKLTRYRGGDRGPVVLAPGFSMAARSFATDTIPVNLAEFLVGRGYDVWLLDYRASIDLPSHRTEFTIDEIARHDWPVAVREVLARTGAHDVQVVGHCVGAVSLLMALGAGMTGVRSAVCSQFSLHPDTTPLNRLKSAVRLGELVEGLGVRGFSPITERTPFDGVVDAALALVPVPRHERCGRAMCRWVNAIYGMTHHHAQLDDLTHRNLYEEFGFGNALGLRHLGLMMRKGVAVDRDGRPAYTSHPSRLAIPIHFLAGRHNHIFRPAGTRRTLAWLRSHNDPDLYTWSLLEDYGHLDGLIGRSAATDVFPLLAEHLDRTADGP